MRCKGSKYGKRERGVIEKKISTAGVPKISIIFHSRWLSAPLSLCKTGQFFPRVRRKRPFPPPKLPVGLKSQNIRHLIGDPSFRIRIFILTENVQLYLVGGQGADVVACRADVGPGVLFPDVFNLKDGTPGAFRGSSASSWRPHAVLCALKNEKEGIGTKLHFFAESHLVLKIYKFKTRIAGRSYVSGSINDMPRWFRKPSERINKSRRKKSTEKSEEEEKRGKIVKNLKFVAAR